MKIIPNISLIAGDSHYTIIGDTDVRESILQGMASIFWGSAWANHADEHRCCNLSGCRIEDYMPTIPAHVHAFVTEVVARIEATNACTVVDLFDRAKAADDTVDDADAERFGDCLAYQYTRAGVSWTDDYNKVPGMVVPYGEDSEIRILADELCEDVTDRKACPSCGSYIGENQMWQGDRCGNCGKVVAWVSGEPYAVPPAWIVSWHKLDRGRHWRAPRKHAKAMRRLYRACREAAR